MRKNPLFDYKAFKAKRTKFVELLAEYFEDTEDETREAIKSMLSPYKDAFSLLKHSTPFYLMVLADSFERIIRDEYSANVDYENAIKLAEFILDVDYDNRVELYAEWLADQTIHLYQVTNFSHFLFLKSRKEKLVRALNSVVQRYNEQKGNEAIRFRFPEEIVDADKFKEEMIDGLLCEERDGEHLSFYMEMGLMTQTKYKITTEEGFLGIFCAYFLSSQIKLAYLSGSANELYYITLENFPYEPNICTLTDNIGIIEDYFELDKVPFWVSSVVERIDFFNVGVHYTNQMFEMGVTPLNLKTKLADYTQGAFVTHGRALPTVTKAKSQRALIYCWRIEHLKKHAYAKKDKFADLPSSYGDNFIFLFTNTILTFLKVGDSDTQSVCLLQDVVETIPFYAKEEYKKEDCFAYFGLSVDGEKPLFEVDLKEWDRKKESFTYFVYEMLCAYLESPEYKIEHNINQTISPKDR